RFSSLMPRAYLSLFSLQKEIYEGFFTAPGQRRPRSVIRRSATLDDLIGNFREVVTCRRPIGSSIDLNQYERSVVGRRAFAPCVYPVEDSLHHFTERKERGFSHEFP